MFEVLHKLHQGARASAPVLSTLFLMLVLMVPLRLPDFGTISPPVALMAVFFWTIYRPDLMGPISVGLLGFLHDVLSGSPLGLNALLCLLTYGSVDSQRQLFQAHGFFVLWWGYAVTAVMSGFIAWAVMSARNWALLPYEAVLFQALAGIALFPLMSWLMGLVQRHLTPEV